MAPKTVMKWEKAVLHVPKNHILSSDFSRYTPPQWKFLEGESEIVHLVANDYQRMWQSERDVMVEKQALEMISEKQDFVKKYVNSIKNYKRPPRPQKKEPFKIKKFKDIPPSFSTHRAPDDKAMSYLKDEKPSLIGVKQSKEKSKPKKTEEQETKTERIGETTESKVEV